MDSLGNQADSEKACLVESDVLKARVGVTSTALTSIATFEKAMIVRK